MTNRTLWLCRCSQGYGESRIMCIYSAVPNIHPLLQVKSILLFVHVFHRISFHSFWLKIVCIKVFADLLYHFCTWIKEPFTAVFDVLYPTLKMAWCVPSN
jgi:hypothetical protein